MLSQWRASSQRGVLRSSPSRGRVARVFTGSDSKQILTQQLFHRTAREIQDFAAPLLGRAERSAQIATGVQL